MKFFSMFSLVNWSLVGEIRNVKAFGEGRGGWSHENYWVSMQE